MKNSIISQASLLPLTKYIEQNQTPVAELPSLYLQQGKLIRSYDVCVYKSVQECRDIWNFFSPNKRIFDLWNFRYAWHQAYQYELHFLTVLQDGKLAGCLPLWNNTDDGYYEWFGGYWMEENNFFANNQLTLQILLEIAPQNMYLFSIYDFALDTSVCPGTCQPLLTRTNCVASADMKYTKKISQSLGIEGYLSALTKKHRYNLKANVRQMEQRGVEIHFSQDKSLLFELANLSKKSFDGVKNEESLFFDAREFQALHNLLVRPEKFSYEFAYARVAGKYLSVDLAFIYNGVYCQFIGASDKNVGGLGNCMFYKELKRAVDLGLNEVDCLQEDHNWKHKYLDGRVIYDLDRRTKTRDDSTLSLREAH